MKNLSIFLMAVCLALLLAQNIDAAETGAPAPVLSIQDCLKISFDKNPELKTSYEQEMSAGASLNMQRTNYNPNVNLSAAYGGNTSNTSGQGIFVEKKYYSGLLSMQITVFDFGRTRYAVLAAKENLSAAHYDFLASVNKVILGVKQAYLLVLGAQKLLEVAEETGKIQQAHLLQAQNFYRVGIRSKIEVTKAEVDLANAKLNLIKSKNVLALARVQLNNSIGLGADSYPYKLDEGELNPGVQGDFGDVYALALKNRPDYHRMTAQMKSLEAQLGKVRSNYNPSLTGSASYGKSGSGDNSSLSDSFGYGLNLSVPVFNQGLTPATFKKTVADMKALGYQQDTLKNTIYKEVESASLNVKESREKIEVLTEALKQAKENYDLAQGRYNLGIGTSLEFQDALLSYTQAKSDLIQAQVQNGVDIAGLEYYTGIRVEGKN
ncbi:MAG: TolC family protein [bacterium]